MLCREGFQAAGEVNLLGASIGQLDFSGAHLDGKDRPALTAQRLTVTSEMFCDKGFKADGELYLRREHRGTASSAARTWTARAAPR